MTRRAALDCPSVQPWAWENRRQPHTDLEERYDPEVVARGSLVAGCSAEAVEEAILDPSVRFLRLNLNAFAGGVVRWRREQTGVPRDGRRGDAPGGTRREGPLGDALRADVAAYRLEEGLEWTRSFAPWRDLDSPWRGSVHGPGDVAGEPVLEDHGVYLP